jgi:3-dehydroquinate dehydratase II
MAISVMVINGPNLNRLGTREPEIYGSASLNDIQEAVAKVAEANDWQLIFRQTNDEAQFVTWLQEASDTCAGVVINPAAFTHYSYAIGDACALVSAPIIEIHLSNPAAREQFRHTSVVAPYVAGTIAGFGLQSYVLAMYALESLIDPTH